MKIKRHRGLWLRFDRVLAHSLLRQLAILAAVLVLALGISYLLMFFSGSDWKGFCQEHDDDKRNGQDQLNPGIQAMHPAVNRIVLAHGDIAQQADPSLQRRSS